MNNTFDVENTNRSNADVNHLVSLKKKKHGLKTVKSIIGQEDYSSVHVSTVNVHLFTVIMRNKTTTSRVSEIQLKRSLRFLSMFVEIV